MKEVDLNILQTKAAELHSIFSLAQQAIPFMEEIFVFVKDFQPLLEKVNTSISENIKKMPDASEQIAMVTQVSEDATNEIMDTVDNLNAKINYLKVNSL